MLWENPGGAEVGRPSGPGLEGTFSHSDTYLEGAANACKGALNSIYCHLWVILLLRQKASWAYRLDVMSSACGTDPILTVPHVLRETGGAAEGPGL